MKPRIFHYYKSSKHFRETLAQAYRTSDATTLALLGKLQYRFNQFGVTAFLFPYEQNKIKQAVASTQPTMQLDLEFK